MNIAKILFFSFLLLVLNKPATAQCEESFQYKVYHAEGTSVGRVEIELSERQSLLNFTVKVYRLNNKEIKEIRSFQKQGTSGTITIDGLDPSYYFIKLEWSGSCEKYIGGMDGILIRNSNG